MIKSDFKAGSPLSQITAGWLNKVANFINNLTAGYGIKINKDTDYPTISVDTSKVATLSDDTPEEVGSSASAGSATSAARADHVHELPLVANTLAFDGNGSLGVKVASGGGLTSDSNGLKLGGLTPSRVVMTDSSGALTTAGSAGSSTGITVITGASWNGTNLVFTTATINLAGGIVTGTTARTAVTIPTVTYNA